MFRRNKDNGDDDGGIDAPPLKPFASKGTHTPSKPPTRAPVLNSSGASVASRKGLSISPRFRPALTANAPARVIAKDWWSGAISAYPAKLPPAND